eukprot:189131-Lingulodinium_polyedra.AAC.1
MEGETLAAARGRLERQGVSVVLTKTGARGRAPHDDRVFYLPWRGGPAVDHGFVGAAEGKWL